MQTVKQNVALYARFHMICHLSEQRYFSTCIRRFLGKDENTIAFFTGHTCHDAFCGAIVNKSGRTTRTADSVLH